MNALINHPSWFRMDRDYTANPNHYMVMSVFGASRWPLLGAKRTSAGRLADKRDLMSARPSVGGLRNQDTSLRASRITTTPLFDCARRSNRSRPYELALLLSPCGTGRD